MNRLALASQDLYSGENSFLDLPWHLNNPAPASKHPLGDSNGVIRSFHHINRLSPTSQGLHNGKSCFFDLLWHLNWFASALQLLLGG